MATTKCDTCNPANDCVFPSDLEIYGLQGPNGPWSWLMNGYLFYGGGGGNGWRGGNGGNRPRTPLPQVPSNQPGWVAPIKVASSAQTACVSCSSVASCCYTAPAGLFTGSGAASDLATMQAHVNASALAYAKQKMQTPPGCITMPSNPLAFLAYCLNEQVGGAPGIFTAPPSFTGIGLSQCTWSVDGGLPPGLSFVDNGNGSAELKGKTTQCGIYQFTVTSYAASGDIYSKIKVTASVLGFQTTSPLPNANACTDYNVQLQACGGTPPYTFVQNQFIPGQIPNGIDLQTNGKLIGKSNGMGTYNFVVVVTDSKQQQCSMPFALTVDPPATMPNIYTNTPLPTGHVGHAYFQQIGINGGCAPYQLVVSVGNLPTGLALSYYPGLSSWAVFGTPTAVANPASFTLKATDSAGQVVSKAFTIIVDTDTVVTGSCANNSSIQSSGSSPPVTPPGGSRPTAGSEMTNAAAINNLITNLQALGCTCPPLQVTIDPMGVNTSFYNAGSCTINVTSSPVDSSCGNAAILPGQTFNYGHCCALNAYTATGTHVFNLGGGVTISITYS